MKGVIALAALITLALGVRSQHGFDSVAIWWIHFFPACAMLYLREPLNAPTKNKIALLIAIITYAGFHTYYIGMHGLIADLESLLAIVRSDFVFWPISVISFIIVTYLTISELKSK